jgi:hypothetical protein
LTKKKFLSSNNTNCQLKDKAPSTGTLERSLLIESEECEFKSCASSKRWKLMIYFSLFDHEKILGSNNAHCLFKDTHLKKPSLIQKNMGSNPAPHQKVINHIIYLSFYADEKYLELKYCKLSKDQHKYT